MAADHADRGVGEQHTDDDRDEEDEVDTGVEAGGWAGESWDIVVVVVVAGGGVEVVVRGDSRRSE